MLWPIPGANNHSHPARARAPLSAARGRRVRALQTGGEVRFDSGSRAAWSTDASNYRQVPLGVVLPRTVDDIIRTVALCRKYGAPITTRGGGTSLAGQACNVAVIIDCSKYLNRVIEIDIAVADLIQFQPLGGETGLGVDVDLVLDAGDTHVDRARTDLQPVGPVRQQRLIAHPQQVAGELICHLRGPGGGRHDVAAADVDVAIQNKGDRPT